MFPQQMPQFVAEIDLAALSVALMWFRFLKAVCFPQCSASAFTCWVFGDISGSQLSQSCGDGGVWAVWGFKEPFP